jgi:hypothetical protein
MVNLTLHLYKLLFSLLDRSPLLIKFGFYALLGNQRFSGGNPGLSWVKINLFNGKLWRVDRSTRLALVNNR